MKYVYLIRNKATKELFTSSSGKSVWPTIGRAKQSWVATWTHNEGYKRVYNPRFDDQSAFELVPIPTAANEIIRLQEVQIKALLSVISSYQEGTYKCW